MGIKKGSIDSCRKKPVPRNEQNFINQKVNELNKNGYIITQGSSILQGGSDEKVKAWRSRALIEKGIKFSCSEQAETV